MDSIKSVSATMTSINTPQRVLDEFIERLNIAVNRSSMHRDRLEAVCNRLFYPDALEIASGEGVKNGEVMTPLEDISLLLTHLGEIASAIEGRLEKIEQL